MDGGNMSGENKCPVSGGHHGHRAAEARSNRDGWPNQLNLKILQQNSPLSDPMGKDFNYAEEFKTLDLDAVIKDLHALMTNSQPWWPDRKSTRLNSSHRSLSRMPSSA